MEKQKKLNRETHTSETNYIKQRNKEKTKKNIRLKHVQNRKTKKQRNNKEKQKTGDSCAVSKTT